MRRIRGDVPAGLIWDQEMELVCGRDDDGVFVPERSNFASEEERREAWLLHRERLIDWCLIGRPWAEEHYGR